MRLVNEIRKKADWYLFVRFAGTATQIWNRPNDVNSIAAHMEKIHHGLRRRLSFIHKY